MIVDCMTCPVRGQGCHDCAVTVLLGLPGSAASSSGGGRGPLDDLPLDAAEKMVVSLFVGAGLVKAAAAAELRAQSEGVQSWGRVQDVG